MEKEIELTEEKEIKIEIKETELDKKGVISRGYEEYFNELSKNTPELPAMDIIVDNFTYKVPVFKNEKHNEPTTLIRTLKEMIKLLNYKKNLEDKIILDNINLNIKSGSTTIILGGPGCGTTTLLQALANQLPKKHTNGNIYYGGENINKYKWNRIAAICEQLNCDNPTLTVRETLDFSRDCLLGNKKFYDNTNVNNDFIV